MPVSITTLPSRRRLLQSAAAFGGALVTGLPRAAAPQAVTSDAMRVGVPYGVQVGDVVGDRAILWSKADRPARMLVRWSTTESMADAVAAPVVNAVEDRDYVGKVDLAGLPPGQRIFYEVSFLDLGDLKSTSEPVRGSFPTAPSERRNVRFVWSGDTAGQGWGINPDFGGMKIYEAMRQVEPDFFIHSGDTIYADGPIKAEATNADGSLWLGPDGKPWRNITIPEKQKVAETLHEYRMNYAYNLMDENVRRMNASVPMYAQWDDHEVTNNWYWEQRKDQDKRYQEGSVARMAAAAMRAFHDYMPTRLHPLEQDRLFTELLLWPVAGDLPRRPALLSGPEQRAASRPSSAPRRGVVGERQMGWLMQALADSKATWKVIACDMPIGLIVWDDGKNKKGTEAVAQGDMGPPLGRELEFAELFRFIRDRGIKQRRLADGRRALHGGAPLRPEQGAVPGVHAVLGVRLGAAQRRQLRPERPRRHLRPAGRVREGARGRAGEPAAFGRAAVLRSGRHRRDDGRDDRAAEGPRRCHAVHPGADAARPEPRLQCRKWRTPVSTMAMPARSAAAITASSLTLPPGWMAAVAPAAMAVSRPSAKGKKASEATTQGRWPARAAA